MRVVVGLGSNLGDRLATLREAVERIARVAEVRARSSVYETAPVGPPQPDYLNAAIAIEWSAPLHALLDELLAIEASMGRVRRERWGARTIDLDILWADVTLDDPPRLIVPHPRLAERAFAVAPLLDVAPDAPFSLPPHPALPGGAATAARVSAL